MSPSRIVGLIPAAGRGSRVQPLPCSKEIYPVGAWSPARTEGARPKVAGHYLMDAMRRGGADQVFIILREGKWDIPAYFRDGSLVSLDVAYLIARLPFGVPYTLDQAYPFVRDCLVAVGMPDLLFRPESAFERLRLRREQTGADVVLGLFPARDPKAVDMVQWDGSGRVRSVIVDGPTDDLDLAWLIALWTSAFTEYLREFVRRDEAARMSRVTPGDEDQAVDEVSVGHVLQAALEDGLTIDGVPFPDGTYLDLGDPRGLLDSARAPVDASAVEKSPEERPAAASG